MSLKKTLTAVLYIYIHTYMTMYESGVDVFIHEARKQNGENLQGPKTVIFLPAFVLASPIGCLRAVNGQRFFRT
jgi:hypothetical protein